MIFHTGMGANKFRLFVGSNPLLPCGRCGPSKLALWPRPSPLELWEARPFDRILSLLGSCM